MDRQNSVRAQQRVLVELRRRLRRRELLPGQRMPTVRALAAELGVDKGTVLRAYRQAVAEGLARASGRQRTRLVACEWFNHPAASEHEPTIVLSVEDERRVEHLTDPGRIAAVVTGIVGALRAAGRTCLVVPPAWIDTPPQRPPRSVIVLNRPSPAGIARLAAWVDSGTAVAADQSALDDPRFHRVGHDHAAGGRLLVETLVADGRKRILPVLGYQQDPLPIWLQERRRGVIAALKDAGLPLLPMPVYPDAGAIARDASEFERQVRMAAGSLIEWIAGPQRVDAMLAITDGMVNHIACACRLAGRACHAEVAIAGYDGYWRDNPERRFDRTAPWATIDKDNLLRGQRLAGLVITPQVRRQGVLEMLPPRLIRPQA